MVIATFRQDFPEFTDPSRYPDAQITFWSTVAEKNLSLDRFGDMWPLAVELYTAHEITLAAQSVQAAGQGGAPGSQGGVAQSKTVGSVSVTYDTQNTSEKDAGWWNLTVYGKQLYRLIKMYGSGCIQL